MPLKLYNSLTKHEEDFIPAHPPAVTMYTCGPTVYGRPHIGNYSSFLMADLLRRWLETGHGYTVKHVKNITDVGHLLHDSDHGDDKVQRQAEQEKVHPLEIAKRYAEQYLEDEKALNILEPTARPRATAYIKEMLSLTKELLRKGNAYETRDGIYFSVETFPAYGTLSGNTLDKLNAGARVKVDEAKKHPADFALWKKCVAGNGHHVLRWSYATGELSTTTGDDARSGFPGWHIECSAMSSALLGEQIDLHTGGEDNIFPHHECEIAQSESVTGKPFVRFWLHKRRIDLAGEKMSKSLGNVLTVPAIVGKGYSPLDLRFYLLSVHYRTNLKFTWRGMDEAKISRRKIMQWIGEVKKAVKNPVEISHHGMDIDTMKFQECMNEDLNTPGALSIIFATMNFFYKNPTIDERDAKLYIEFIEMIRHTFGCFEPEKEEGIPPSVQAFVDARAAARAAQDFKESDRLRDEIKKMGYEVRDEKNEQKIKKL